MSVLFFCVGATKAGTSWLHAQLARHPQCHFRTIKELHYFDALEKDALGDELAKHRKHQNSLLERLAKNGRAPSQQQAARIADRGEWMNVLEADVEDQEAYLSYLRKGAESGQVIGDLTPAYSLLPAAKLSKMARIAPDVRVLYLMRDPVERLWSQLRGVAKRRSADGTVTREACDWLFQRLLSGQEEQIASRCDYQSAIEKLKVAFAPAKLLFEVFEDMVRGAGLTRIYDFLGINAIAPDPTPVHVGQTLAMTDTQREKAMDWLMPQYHAAETALGRWPADWAQGELR